VVRDDTSLDSGVAGLAAGFRLPIEAGRLLLRERRLWGLALVPLALSLAAFVAAAGIVIANAAELHGWTSGWMPDPRAERWYQWLWIGPLELAFRLLAVLLFAAVAGACLVAAYLVASVLASPFHDALAYRVEQIVTGRVSDVTRSGFAGIVAEAGRSVREELRRILFFVSIVAPLALAGFVIPGAQLITGPAIVAFTIFFLPLDYASYALDRRHVEFAAKRRWVLSQKPLMAGFGGAAFLTCAVPLLNLAAMPVLVVAGTLLVVRHAAGGQAAPGASSPR
jgi:uncharacterized protein involved in cysteine biosynthesis